MAQNVHFMEEVNQRIKPNSMSTGPKAYSGSIYLTLTWHMSDLHRNVRLLMQISYQVRGEINTIICHLVRRATQQCVCELCAGLFFHVSPCCLRQPAVQWASGVVGWRAFRGGGWGGGARRQLCRAECWWQFVCGNSTWLCLESD